MARKRNRYQQFYDAVDFLKENIPAPHPVCVQRLSMKEDHGRCYYKKKRFIIIVNKNLSLEMSIETLLHEWAHTLAWDDHKEHGFKWGRAFSRVYRTFIER